MDVVFNNPVLQKKFQRDGFIVVDQLLNTCEINILTSLFQKFKPQFEQPFHTSHFSADSNYKQEVHNTIAQTVFPKVEPLLIDYTPLFGNFMIKNPDPNVGMDLHADWTYVDENKHTSLAIWVPLIDVDETNGCFGVVEGSHHVTNIIRGPLIRQSTRDHEPEWERKFGKLLPMKAGDAVIYNHRLLHFSHANQSAVVRPAINLSVVPLKADWIHYCMPEGSEEIKVYKVSDSNFYLQYIHFQTPQTNTLTGTLPRNTVKYMDSRMKYFPLLLWINRIKSKLS